MGRPKLAFNIRHLRIKLSYTQEQFAGKVGVTFSTVNRWENDKSRPSPLALNKLNRLFRKEMNRNIV